VTDDDLEKRIRAGLADAAADVEPTGTLAGLRARIAGGRPMTHLCPARRCPRMVPDHLLACGPHWRLVPSPLARAVYTAYARGDGIGSPELIAAQSAAIRAINRAIGETGP
jgi:hypothetical protein